MLRKSHKAQAFIEFALVIPLLILVALGVVELTIYIGTYINLTDLSREAARFASIRDPFELASQGDKNCNTPDSFNFYYDTSCIFSPLQGSAACISPTFCNGFNSTVPLKPEEDDILISIFTVRDDTTQNPAKQIVSDQWPQPNGVWVWSNNDSDTSHQNNYRRNCNRLTSPDTSTPYYTKTKVEEYLRSGQSSASKGFVVVEVVYCYHQALNIPILSDVIPDPLILRTYTIMSLPSAAPTPTPKP